MSSFDAYVGLDVNKDTISIAIAEAERDGDVRFIGTIPHETTTINRTVKNLAAKYKDVNGGAILGHSSGGILLSRAA